MATDAQTELAEEAKLAGIKTKTCHACGSRFPLTGEFWNLRGENMDVTDDRCIECEKIAADLSVKLNGKKGGLLAKIAKGQILDTGTTEHLYDEIMQVFGGTREFAHNLKFDYDSAEPGSHARISIARMVISLAEAADKSRRNTDLGDLTEPADLLRQLAGLKVGIQEASLVMPEEEIQEDG